MRELPADIPDPNVLLAMAPEELAGFLLRAVARRLQNGIFHPGNSEGEVFGRETPNRYPATVQLEREVKLALAEAWNWLRVQSLGRKVEREVMRKPLVLKKRHLKALHGKPVIPKHQPPAKLEGVLLTDHDRKFFEEFRAFGEIFNEGEADPEFGSAWRIQELPESELKNGWRGSPAYGRCYDVFYNQMVVGRLELFPESSYSFDGQTPKTIYADLKLDYVRRVPFDSLYVPQHRDQRAVNHGIVSSVADEVAHRREETRRPKQTPRRRSAGCGVGQ